MLEVKTGIEMTIEYLLSSHYIIIPHFPACFVLYQACTTPTLLVDGSRERLGRGISIQFLLKLFSFMYSQNLVTDWEKINVNWAILYLTALGCSTLYHASRLLDWYYSHGVSQHKSHSLPHGHWGPPESTTIIKKKIWSCTFPEGSWSVFWIDLKPIQSEEWNIPQSGQTDQNEVFHFRFVSPLTSK